MIRIGGWPWLSLLLAGLALALAGEQAAATWQYDRSAIGNGAWWLALSGHLTHWTPSQLRWDLLGWLVIAALAESWRPHALRLAIVLAAPVIAIALLLLQAELLWYRGLSGLVTTALGVQIAAWWRAASAEQRWAARGALVLVALKIGTEALTGRCLLAEVEGVPPVPLAHGVGFAVGILVTWALSRAGLRRGTAPIDRRSASPLAQPDGCQT